MASHPSGKGLSPVSEDFTYTRFRQLLKECERADKDSIKAFIISGGSIAGIGNGYLHDVVFRAGIHPTRKVGDITGRERQRLYNAIRATVREAISKGGRDTERNLHNMPGGYRPILDSRAKGKPCPTCGMPVEKIQYLGGASYFCPACQT
jgi:formamidopyrimidine-DNA glycosylase